MIFYTLSPSQSAKGPNYIIVCRTCGWSVQTNVSTNVFGVAEEKDGLLSHYETKHLAEYQMALLAGEAIVIGQFEFNLLKDLLYHPGEKFE